MKLVESKAEFLPQESNVEGIYKMVEIAGRTAYKSESNITADSAKAFVEKMMKSNHGACLEHGAVYFTRHYNSKDERLNDDFLIKYYDTYPYTRINTVRDNEKDRQGPQTSYISTNLRVLFENGWMDDLQYICEPTEHHIKRYSFRLTCDRGVSHELVRHRVFSFLQESTRYCNYGKNKFGNEVTFCIPQWVVNVPEGRVRYHDGICYRVGITDNNPSNFVSIIPSSFNGNEEIAEQYHTWLSALDSCERNYMDLLELGWTPQQARQVLPNALKTEIIVTGFEEDWKHFFDLRLFGTTGAPHPDMKLLAEKMLNEAHDSNIFMDIKLQ